MEEKHGSQPVTVEELRLEFRRKKVPGFAYSIGRDENETYCLVQESDGWHVFYSERGIRRTEKVFASESAACEELVRRVLGDSVVRSWMEERST